MFASIFLFIKIPKFSEQEVTKKIIDNIKINGFL
tara:strand:+ start:4142 stop:4243 length:102 start_codon:yes stop_codon:yes gene_type:complete